MDDGVWRWNALRADGLTRAAINASVATGLLVHLRRGVYASAGTCLRVRAAALHGGAPACVTAAAHAGLWVLDDQKTHVWIRSKGHRRGHADCSCVEHWEAGQGARFLARPTIPQILRQIYRCQGAEAFFVALESARRQSFLSPRQLRTLRNGLDAPGRDLVDFSRSDADSGLESLVRLRLRGHGLSVRTQVSISSVGRVDLLIGASLIVEVDGQLGHADGAERHKDLRRDANAAAWGYRTLRFDYALVIHDWDLVERAILAAI